MNRIREQKIKKFALSCCSVICALVAAYCFVNMVLIRVDTAEDFLIKRSFVRWNYVLWPTAFLLYRVAYPLKEKSLPAASIMEQMFGTLGTAIAEVIVVTFVVWAYSAFIMWNEYSRILGPNLYDDWLYRLLRL